MRTLFEDLRFGLRAFAKDRTFTAIAVLTLALGIGANTMIFSVVNTLFWKALPYREPGRLVNVWQTEIQQPDRLNIVSAPNYFDWQRQSHVFESMALFDSAGKGYNLSGEKEPERVRGLRVSASLFPLLGINPYLGRTFLPEEETWETIARSSSATDSGSAAMAPIARWWAKPSEWTGRTTRLSA